MGRAPRVLWGWSAEERTRFIYDDSGRVVQAITTQESEFDAEQLALLRAAVEWRESLGPHGHPIEEAMSPLADPTKRGGTHYYVAGQEITRPDGTKKRVPLVDHAKKAEMDAVDAYRAAAGENANLNGLVWPVERIDRA